MGSEQAADADGTLKNINADKNMIHALYAENLISSDARDFAFRKIIPPRDWGVWAFRLLMSIGSTLVLAGIIFFFAYNWDDIPPLVKLGLIEGALVLCIAGLLAAGLKVLTGQLLLLAASILVGVFMAVFGQIYQTGADAYTLFLMWAVLTLGWTIVARNPVQWLFWLVIANFALYLWWVQEMALSYNEYSLIFALLVLLNGSALVTREIVLQNGKQNLVNACTRYLILLTILYFATMPVVSWVFRSGIPGGGALPAITISAIIGALALAILFYVYRYILPDIWSNALVVVAWFVVLEAAILEHVSPLLAQPWKYLFTGFLTLVLLTLAASYLRSASAYIRRIESHG